MTSDPYYQSPRWAEIRKARLQYDGFRCVDCSEGSVIAAICFYTTGLRWLGQ